MLNSKGEKMLNDTMKDNARRLRVMSQVLRLLESGNARSKSILFEKSNAIGYGELTIALDDCRKLGMVESDSNGNWKIVV